MVIAGSGSEKINALLNLIKEQDDIEKNYLSAKYLSKRKYEFLIKKRKNAGIKHFNDPNVFIECSNTVNNICEDIDDYKSSRKRKILIEFEDMIVDIMTNKQFQAIIKELFIRCKKINISLAFITQSYFSVPKGVRLNSTRNLIIKINNRKELLNIAINHSADIDYNDCVRIYRECTRKPYPFLTIDTTLSASDPLRFRKNLYLRNIRNNLLPL